MEYLRTYGLEMYIWQRHSLSRNIVPDYTVFSLALFGKETPVCALLEVKNSAHFNVEEATHRCAE